jgi:hypothetical protein
MRSKTCLLCHSLFLFKGKGPYCEKHTPLKDRCPPLGPLHVQITPDQLSPTIGLSILSGTVPYLALRAQFPDAELCCFNQLEYTLCQLALDTQARLPEPIRSHVLTVLRQPRWARCE